MFWIECRINFESLNLCNYNLVRNLISLMLLVKICLHQEILSPYSAFAVHNVLTLASCPLFR